MLDDFSIRDIIISMAVLIGVIVLLPKGKRRR
jgi:hypothetical protein